MNIILLEGMKEYASVKKNIAKKPFREPLKLLVYSVRGKGLLFIFIDALGPFISFNRASFMTACPINIEFGIEEL